MRMDWMRGLVAAALVGLTLGFVWGPEHASANAPEDVQGVGARVNAMGGAGTALSTDFSGTYYNPANLSRCQNSQLGIALRHTFYGLDVNDRSAPVAGDPDGDPTNDDDYPTPKPLRDQTRVSIGFCNHLPFNFSFGMMIGLGLQDPMTLDQSTLNARPHWLLYGEQLEGLSIALGVSYKPIEQLSIGLGTSILIHSFLAVGTEIEIASADPSEVTFQWQLQPAAALYAGIQATPIPELHIGFTYRGALFHDLDTPVQVDAGAFGLTIPIDLFVESAAWYTPQQVAFGVSAEPIPQLTLAMDITWYNYAAHPGPFMQAVPGEGVAAAAIAFPERESFGQRNIVVPRFGAEFRAMENRLAFRAGYNYRPSIVARPASQPCTTQTGVSFTCRANVLDGNVHSISLGAGYRFGDLPDELRNPYASDVPEGDEEEIDEIEDEALAPTPDTPASGGQPSWAAGTTSPERGETPAPAAAEATGDDEDNPLGASASVGSGEPAGQSGRVGVDPEGERTYDPHRSVGANASVDVFFRASMMSNRSVTRNAADAEYLNDFSYGGAVIDLGVTFTLGWF